MHSVHIIMVNSAEFQCNIALNQEAALKRLVVITKNGCPRSVLISVEEYERLNRHDRRVAAFLGSHGSGPIR